MNIWLLIFILFWIIGSVLSLILNIKIAHRRDWFGPFKKYGFLGVLDYFVPIIMSWVGLAVFAFQTKE